MDADAAASGGSEAEEEIDDGASVVTTATGATTATASGEKDGKEKGGWLSKMTMMRRKTAADAKKPPTDPKKGDLRKASLATGSSSSKLVIGAPSNFTHVKSITPDIPTLSKSVSATSIDSMTAGLPRQSSALSAKLSHGTDASSSSSVPGSAGVAADDEPADQVVIMPASASVKMATLQDLTYGGYFLRHLRGEARQVFLACSADYQQLTLWASYYDMAERKQRPETVPIADIVDIKTGVVFESAEDKHDALSFAITLSNNRSLDLEAFTPDDRDRWVSAFRAVRQFSAKA